MSNWCQCCVKPFKDHADDEVWIDWISSYLVYDMPGLHNHPQLIQAVLGFSYRCTHWPEAMSVFSSVVAVIEPSEYHKFVQYIHTRFTPQPLLSQELESLQQEFKKAQETSYSG